jgi:hypothetical protein
MIYARKHSRDLAGPGHLNGPANPVTTIEGPVPSPSQYHLSEMKSHSTIVCMSRIEIARDMKGGELPKPTLMLIGESFVCLGLRLTRYTREMKGC